MTKDSDFVVRYTNKDIINEIKALHLKFDSHAKQAERIEEKTDTNRKLIYGAYAFALFILGIFVSYVVANPNG